MSAIFVKGPKSPLHKSAFAIVRLSESSHMSGLSEVRTHVARKMMILKIVWYLGRNTVSVYTIYAVFASVSVPIREIYSRRKLILQKVFVDETSHRIYGAICVCIFVFNER